MTTPENTPAPDAPTDDTTAPVPELDTAAPVEPDSPNSEAAKRRRQLRETQTELSTVRDQLAGYQRRHAEQIIADVLATPADLFDIGHADLADYLDDNGNILDDELRTAATALVEQRPRLAANYQPPMPDGTNFDHGVRQSAPGGTSWSAVLGDQRRRQSSTQ